ncbi:hypothetical protein DFH28DRAFT_259745 [Melampsora americana]|nr:hypothetical protein DFH28DRAFT_259745 [Melampsora americana]
MKRKYNSDQEESRPRSIKIKSSKRNQIKRSRSITTNQQETEEEEEQITPKQSKQTNQEELEIIRSSSKESIQEDLKSEKRSKLNHILNQYNEGKVQIKDYRDTISQISYQISKDISISLIKWEHELKHQISNQSSTIWNSQFTLWPLSPSSLSLKSEWSFDEELMGLSNRVYFEKHRAKFNSFLNDDDDDDLNLNFELNSLQLDLILKEVHQSFEKILIELIKYVPRTHHPPLSLNQITESSDSKELEPGLKWKDILKVATHLGIHQNVLDRTQHRLELLYKGTSIFDHPLSEMVE